jgi:bifunctional DNA-binding transcriptional regulator/antitoxin component of YhaV-PrlF toxin-antitoxin module
MPAKHANIGNSVILIYLNFYMSDVIHTKMGEGRRIAIPAELCQRYGIEPGDPVVLEPSDSGIVMRPLDAVIREVQAFFADAAPPDVLLSEELIRDRREEAKRESRD